MTNNRILVVDDEPNLIKSLSFILTRGGFEVSTAEDGEEALRKAAEIKPVMMFLDIMMPKKNGYDVCQIIKSTPGLKDIYIIMLSAKGWEADREKALNLGADEFMSKPFSPVEVINKVSKTMQEYFQCSSGRV